MQPLVKLFAFLLLLVTLHAPARAQNAQVSVSTKLERDSVLVGDQVLFSVAVSMPPTIGVKFPNIVDTLGNGIEVIGKPLIDTTLTDGSATYTMRMLITAFDSGLHVIPELPLVLHYADQTDTVNSPMRPFLVTVMPHNPDVPDIFDIKPPMLEPITFAEVVPWVGLGMLLAAIVVLLIVYLKKRRQHKPFLKIFKPAEPPHVVALRELNKLKEQKLWASNNHKHYHTRLTDILRIYLAGRFAIDAQEKTTGEIIDELQKVDYQFNSLLADLNELLDFSDLVKFAKYTPNANENEQLLDFAIAFVNATKPVENQRVEDKSNVTTPGETLDAGNLSAKNATLLSENQVNTLDENPGEKPDGRPVEIGPKKGEADLGPNDDVTTDK